MSRKIVNPDDVSIYVSSLIGKGDTGDCLSSEWTDPNFVREHKTNIVNEMVYYTFYPLFVEHLKRQARGAGVSAYGLRHLEVKDPEYRNLSRYEQLIVRGFDKEKYAWENYKDPVSNPCIYNPFFKFREVNVSSGTREKLGKMVTYLKEQISDYIMENLMAAAHYEDLLDYGRSFPELKFKGAIHLDPNYLSIFSSLNDVWNATEVSAKRKKPTCLAKQPPVSGNSPPCLAKQPNNQPSRQGRLF